jgi:Mn-dependent DtxR family transcriptional regulator
VHAHRRARVHRLHEAGVAELARDLGLSSQEAIERLKRLGVEAKTASSSVDEDTADKLKRALKIDALAASKRRVYGSDEDESEREQQERDDELQSSLGHHAALREC